MQVKELIEQLKKLPPHAEVRVSESADEDTRPENYWLGEVDFQETAFVDEVVLIGYE